MKSNMISIAKDLINVSSLADKYEKELGLSRIQALEKAFADSRTDVSTECYRK